MFVFRVRGCRTKRALCAYAHVPARKGFRVYRAPFGGRRCKALYMGIHEAVPGMPLLVQASCIYRFCYTAIPEAVPGIEANVSPTCRRLCGSCVCKPLMKGLRWHVAQSSCRLWSFWGVRPEVRCPTAPLAQGHIPGKVPPGLLPENSLVTSSVCICCCVCSCEAGTIPGLIATAARTVNGRHLQTCAREFVCCAYISIDAWLQKFLVGLFCMCNMVCVMSFVLD